VWDRSRVVGAQGSVHPVNSCNRCPLQQVPATSRAISRAVLSVDFMQASMLVTGQGTPGLTLSRPRAAGWQSGQCACMQHK
jgi:hypothetical protein